MQIQRVLQLMLFLFCGVLLTACTKPQQGPQPLPTIKVGIAYFSQPRTVGELMAGYVTEDSPAIDPAVFPHLDSIFAETLAFETKRTYTTVDAAYACREAGETVAGKKGRRPAIEQWLAIGRCMDVELLIVPHLLSWHERDGGELGVTNPAGVVIDFYMLDITTGVLVSRSHFEEIQASLSDNILDVDKFVERGGKWITASALAREGMRKAIRELGL